MGLDDIFEDKNGNVILKGIPQRILKNNKELVPLSQSRKNMGSAVAMLPGKFGISLKVQ